MHLFNLNSHDELAATAAPVKCLFDVHTFVHSFCRHVVALLQIIPAPTVDDTNRCSARARLVMHIILFSISIMMIAVLCIAIITAVMILSILIHHRLITIPWKLPLRCIVSAHVLDMDTRKNSLRKT